MRCHFHQVKTSVQFSSVAQLCPTLCNPMNCSPPGVPVHHQLPESTKSVQTYSYIYISCMLYKHKHICCV